MADMLSCPVDVSFLEPAINADPFPTYERLLAEKPIYFDPAVNFFIVTRYDDIRRILADPKTFSSASWLDSAQKQVHSEHAEKMRERFEAKGWIPVPTLGTTDNPRHNELRTIFDAAFRPARIKEMEGAIRETAEGLVDAFPQNPVEIVSAFAVPLPLIVICQQTGARREDVWRIKAWMDALISRAGFMLTEEQEGHVVDQLIEAQHYFKKAIDELRGKPDGTVLGDLVNASIGSGGSMSDAELMSNIMDSIFLAGTETTTNSISGGIRILCSQPELFTRIKSDMDKYLRVFVEEVLRLETPSQGIYRVVATQTEIHGVTLPPGSVLHLRIAAANRDDRKFPAPCDLDLERKNSGGHLAFGSGIHHCIGAPLARREMHWAFMTLLTRFNGVRFSPEQQEIEYLPNYMFRSIRKLQVEFLK
jgi:cytochrome P450